MGGEAQHFPLVSVVKVDLHEGTLVYFFSASLALAREETPTSVSLRIGRVGYFSRNKFNVSLLTQNKGKEEFFSKFVNDFPVFYIF